MAGVKAENALCKKKKVLTTTKKAEMCICVLVCLTASLSCPSVSALWPSRASAVSWKHVTHWLSPKSAKLAWESDRRGWWRGGGGRHYLHKCDDRRDNIPHIQQHVWQTSGNHVLGALTERRSLYLKLGKSLLHFSQRYLPFCWSMTFLLQSADGQAWYRQFLRAYTSVATQLK